MHHTHINHFDFENMYGSAVLTAYTIGVTHTKVHSGMEHTSRSTDVRHCLTFTTKTGTQVKVIAVLFRQRSVDLWPARVERLDCELSVPLYHATMQIRRIVVSCCHLSGVFWLTDASSTLTVDDEPFVVNFNDFTVDTAVIRSEITSATVSESTEAGVVVHDGLAITRQFVMLLDPFVDDLFSH